MTPFENAELFATKLLLSMPLQDALDELTSIEENKGEDSPEYKITLELLCHAIQSIPNGEIAEA